MNKNRPFKTKFLIFVGIILILVFCLPFIAGKFSNDSKIEEISAYAAEVVKQNIKKSQYLSVTVEHKDNSEPLPNPYDEFFRLYGVFRQEQASFGSGVNFFDSNKGDKIHDIYLEDYKGSRISSNLSFFYLGPVGSIEYNGHYKHYVYPFELMFVDNKNYDVSRYLAYISKSHADKVLESLGECRNENGIYSSEQYASLIRKKINMYIDGEIHEYVINNIYFEQNYYYYAMRDTFSDFILTSYFSPNGNALISERKNVYFMNQYSYQNKYYMEYINNIYKTKNFKVDINKNNLEQPIDDGKILDFYYSSLSSEHVGIFILLIVIFYILLVGCLAFIIVLNFNFSISSLIFLWICSFIPYFIFWMIFKISKSSTLFTKCAGMNYFIGSLIMIFTFVVWHLLNKYLLGKD